MMPPQLPHAARDGGNEEGARSRERKDVYAMFLPNMVGTSEIEGIRAGLETERPKICSCS